MPFRESNPKAVCTQCDELSSHTCPACDVPLCDAHAPDERWLAELCLECAAQLGQVALDLQQIDLQHPKTVEALSTLSRAVLVRRRRWFPRALRVCVGMMGIGTLVGLATDSVAIIGAAFGIPTVALVVGFSFAAARDAMGTERVRAANRRAFISVKRRALAKRPQRQLAAAPQNDDPPVSD